MHISSWLWSEAMRSYLADWHTALSLDQLSVSYLLSSDTHTHTHTHQ